MSNLNFLDAHGHIQFPAFDADRAEVIKRAQSERVKMIAVGTQAETSKRAIEVAKEFPDNVWATVGFHPNHLLKEWHHDKNEQSGAEPEVFDIKVLEKLAKDEKVVAISECGFDLFYDASAVKIQESVFFEQADLAKRLNKPLMMHCRPSKGSDNAYEYALNVLNDSKFKDLTKIMHFYAGSLDMAKRLADLGFYFTFGGVITFSKSYEEVINYLPLNRIFAETDCPYVAPQSHRGQRNEPVYMIETVKRLAEIKGLIFEDVAGNLYKNSSDVFKIH